MNKIDYNRIFEEEAKRYQGKKLLLHCCCAPCFLGVAERVIQCFDVTLFWFNPNIMPEAEHDLRYRELYKTADKFGLPVIKREYENHRFMSFAGDMKEEREGGARCDKCISLRIRETAAYAGENEFDLFATTLTVSPHKNADLINRIGEECSSHARWLHSDFKKKNGFLRSGELCAEYGVYRQNYCGCKL